MGALQPALQRGCILPSIASSKQAGASTGAQTKSTTRGHQSALCWVSHALEQAFLTSQTICSDIYGMGRTGEYFNSTLVALCKLHGFYFTVR